MTLRIANRDARRLVLALQGLADPPRRAMDTDRLHDLIERLGFVQLDSIQTVARAHHMILRARCDGYRPALLHRLHERERRLFEHWTHDAALIPVAFYPHWQRRFARETERTAERFARWHGPEFDREVAAIVERIAGDGPIMARDVSQPRPGGAGGWWNWHDGKIALEFLWRSGRLAIPARQNFQKVYDLAERVIPEAHRHVVDEAAFVDWACAGALARLGFAAPGDIARFWDLVSIDEAKAWCTAAEAAGAARRVTVEQDGGTREATLLARPDIEELLGRSTDPPDRLRALSPFDPVARDRKRLEQLFGFDFRIEVFVPAPKRRYGYYVFPLLEGDRFVGRIDMAADRDGDALAVKALWLEPGVRPSKARLGRLDAELDRQRRFVGLGTVRHADGWLRPAG
ncbi:MAG: crosslink repair DNA glycosylase YcaQ family protein [Alphaproteobacteria bacterium]